ncbi:NF-kappa-B inhibitor cactus-like [Harpegnathos saltator]|uniref:NF-kappa-B inhibitor cactus-like n=1 Tax=Harpegnathos saltator TaxID=610380 RepID=UPI00058DC2F7|nr:NF-kappa-B inhibitor cactus-like [Harpegnathos saltator]
MWHPSKRSTQQMEEEYAPAPATREDEKRWRRDGNGNNDKLTTTTTTGTASSGNIDSGFLSSGNLQTSGEICDSGLQLLSRGDCGEEGRESEEREQQQRGRRAGATPAPAITTTVSSSSSSAATTIAEPMRVDSGLVVDLGLSESLSQLSLKQVALNPLTGSRSALDQAKSKLEANIELTPVRADPSSDYDIRSDVDVEPQQLQDCSYDGNDNVVASERRAISSEEPWELYYTQDDDGDTQLHIAIVQGFVEATFSLIKMAPHPCLLNTLNDDCQSPLHLAVLTHQPTIVRRLILAGADLSLRNFRGNTALHLACASGDLACAKALTDPLSPMERNELMPGQKVPALPQNLEQRNYSGEMCLHVAAANGQVDLVRLLLRLGADLEAREALAGRTALHIAVERGCRLVVGFLLHECRPCLDAQTYAGMTAYQLALCFDDIQLARELVRLGASPQPLPESSDSESEDEEATASSPAANFLPTIVNVQNAVGVKV